MYLVVKVKSKYAKKARLRAKVLGKRSRKLSTRTKQDQDEPQVKLQVSAQGEEPRGCP